MVYLVRTSTVQVQYKYNYCYYSKPYTHRERELVLDDRLAISFTIVLVLNRQAAALRTVLLLSV